MHAVDRLVLEQQLVILGDGDEEEDGGDVFEAVDPFLAFGPLPAHVEHAVGEVANDKGGFGDARGLDPRAQDVLIRGEVVGLGDAVDRVKVAICKVSYLLIEIFFFFFFFLFLEKKKKVAAYYLAESFN